MNFRDSHSFECNWDDCSNIHTTITSTSATKMNSDILSIPDVQSTLDTRHIAIQKVGVNVNQIARRVNSTGNVYKEDLEEIKGALDKIWQLQRYTLSKLR